MLTIYKKAVILSVLLSFGYTVNAQVTENNYLQQNSLNNAEHNATLLSDTQDNKSIAQNNKTSASLYNYVLADTTKVADIVEVETTFDTKDYQEEYLALTDNLKNINNNNATNKSNDIANNKDALVMHNCSHHVVTNVDCLSDFAQKTEENLCLEFIDCNQIREFGEKHNVDGSFVLYSLNDNKLIGYNFELANTPLNPGASFKYINALTALDTGVALNIDDVLYERYKNAYKLPQSDQHLCIRNSFINNSTKFSAFLAAMIGPERFSDALYRLTGKRADLNNSNIESFWFDGSFKYSAIDEINYLSRLANLDLDFSIEAQKQVLEASMLAVLDKNGNVVATRGYRGETAQEAQEHKSLDTSHYFVIYGKSSANEKNLDYQYVRYSGIVKDNVGRIFVYSSVLHQEDNATPIRVVNLTVDLLRFLNVIPQKPSNAQMVASNRSVQSAKNK